MAPLRRARMRGRAALIIATAEEVCLEQGTDVGVVAFLDRSAITIAGVVDQDVDAAEPLLGLFYSRPARVGDVKGNGKHALRRCVGQVGDLRSVARGDDSIVAGPDHSFGERAAQPGRLAGDKPGGHEGWALIRARFLSLLLTTIHGAMSVSVASNVSSFVAV